MEHRHLRIDFVDGNSPRRGQRVSSAALGGGGGVLQCGDKPF